MSDEESKPSVPRKPKYKTLTPLEYGKAKRLYELGSSTLTELAEQFGVKPQSLHERFGRDGVVKGSRVAEVLEKMDTAISNEAEVSARRITETKEQHYKYAEAIAKMTMQSIINARSNGKAISTADADISALGKAAKALEITRRERYTLLGLDSDGIDPNEIDEILITEMTQEQIADLQAAATAITDNSEGIDALLDDIEIVEKNLDIEDQ